MRRKHDQNILYDKKVQTEERKELYQLRPRNNMVVYEESRAFLSFHGNITAKLMQHAALS